jgi:hypothetical protein
MTYRVPAVAAAALLAMVTAAHADRAAADRCAAALPAASKALYNASLAEVLGGETPKDALTGNARTMVMNGSLSRSAARPAAEAAAPCLQQLR